jgi:predicted metal-binding membrane protein
MTTLDDTRASAGATAVPSPPSPPAPPRPGRVPWVVPAAVALAWAVAIAVHLSGLGHQLHPGGHGGGTAMPAGHEHMAHMEHMEHMAGQAGGAAGPPWPAVLALYGGAWVVMVAAMMLPSATPMLRLFTAASAAQPRPGRALGAFVGGYLAVWAAFGVVALGADAAAERVEASAPGLAARPWLVPAATLVLAGAFQFSPLKDACLDACRHPAAWLLRRYRRGTGPALSLGWGHGLFCLGCCWALMLVMVVAGLTDLRWMAGLAALMAYEKVGRHGRPVARAAGVALVVAGVAVALAGA